MTNATAGMVRVLVQLLASASFLARLHSVLVLLPLAGAVSFWTGRRAQDLQLAAIEAGTEGKRLRKHLFAEATSAVSGKEVRVFGLANELIARHHRAATAAAHLRDTAEWRGPWGWPFAVLLPQAMWCSLSASPPG